MPECSWLIVCCPHGRTQYRLLYKQSSYSEIYFPISELPPCLKIPILHASIRQTESLCESLCISFCYHTYFHLFNKYSFIYLSIYLFIYVCVYMPLCTCGDLGKTHCTRFSHFTLRVLKTELTSPGLGTATWTCWTILPSPFTVNCTWFWDKTQYFDTIYEVQ